MQCKSWAGNHWIVNWDAGNGSVAILAEIDLQNAEKPMKNVLLC